VHRTTPKPAEEYILNVPYLSAIRDSIHPLGYVAMILILSGVAVLQFGSRQASVEVSRPPAQRAPA
jgi:hypothetical protein